MDFSDELEQAADQFKTAIVEFIDSSMPPPNAPSTIAKKGHGRTLIDSERMRNSVERRVDKGSLEVGIFDPEVAEYAFWVHDGTKRIPPRPFLAQAVDENIERILAQLELGIVQKVNTLFD
jgi:hypothetical protein